jgi:hypothetical protein
MSSLRHRAPFQSDGIDTILRSENAAGAHAADPGGFR